MGYLAFSAAVTIFLYRAILEERLAAWWSPGWATATAWAVGLVVISLMSVGLLGELLAARARLRSHP